MNATLNTFPPFQSMNSPQGWALAAIVLVHFGFFLVLSSGMGGRIVDAFRPPPMVVIPAPDLEVPPPEPTPASERIKIKNDQRVVVTEPLLPPEKIAEAFTAESETVVPPVIDDGGHEAHEPVVTAPDFDARWELSEPVYPAAEIRAGHTGTVLLSIYVLDNGRVGEVRLDRSSGYQRLDESAMREARRWRLKPGMRDGVPVAMWKQVPVTFRLQNEGSRRF